MEARLNVMAGPAAAEAIKHIIAASQALAESTPPSSPCEAEGTHGEDGGHPRSRRSRRRWQCVGRSKLPDSPQG